MIKGEIKLCCTIIAVCFFVGITGIFIVDNRTRQVGFADFSPAFSFKIESGHAEVTVLGQSYIIGPEN